MTRVSKQEDPLLQAMVQASGDGWVGVDGVM